MTAEEARAFFLKSSSYANMVLPEYFDFQPVLDFAFSKVAGGKLKSMIDSKALKTTENANYSIILNKDAGYDWREVKIVHPFLYADLVEQITEETHWKELLDRFALFESNSKIKCISLPVESTSKKGDTAETILNWWEGLEQTSIVKSLEYTYCIKTDITNCYGSIYTHTIDWAIRGKDDAKQATTNGKDKSFAHKLDQTVEKLQCNQTNGIPQGGELFNFIAEIVLGYSDYLLSEELKDLNDVDWQVVRYRDDYRIFSNSKEVAERVVKSIADILSGLNMHFNTKKTGLVSDIIESAIKPDKVYWNARVPIIMPKIWDGKYHRVDYQLTLQKNFQIQEVSVRL
ncbi:RNA-directed DNA polymerase [Lactiplantibacillus fabifermentans]|uniref:RNA-directed DNA polymerase n=1 Tax=Lactiplantibacillus fabifermentans TaxID=483011 RepID=UPI001FD1D1A0|nr:RNA-directed DNA polymerase [Lactiplantibacillus fabifermentans]